MNTFEQVKKFFKVPGLVAIYGDCILVHFPPGEGPIGKFVVWRLGYYGGKSNGNYFHYSFDPDWGGPQMVTVLQEAAEKLEERGLRPFNNIKTLIDSARKEGEGPTVDEVLEVALSR